MDALFYRIIQEKVMPSPSVRGCIIGGESRTVNLKGLSEEETSAILTDTKAFREEIRKEIQMVQGAPPKIELRLKEGLLHLFIGGDPGMPSYWRWK